MLEFLNKMYAPVHDVHPDCGHAVGPQQDVLGPELPVQLEL
jgi:hypothetical protein